ncbi:MAG TPA: radical SAM protein [Nitrospinota bacterium]|jgi:radical SAM superfamily enzyme YgiQ (UPF0313 family)|nr:radical SAM protein [Nitrospinota bacterium]|tara:strand:+ start:1213 stop:2988 length:1776 start_codon:yes stop_codon:yes gene_type:complete
MKILILNSVGVDEKGFIMVHSPSRWSLGVKNFTNCVYYPWELAYTSALLKNKTDHEVKMLDGVQNRWNHDTYLEKIHEENPDFIVMDSSTRTIESDLKLAGEAKKRCGTKIILAGQHATAFPGAIQKVADYVCLGEYEYTVLDIINEKERKNIPGIYPNKRRELLNINTLPFPEDEDIRRIDYHEPNCEYKEIQMYASRGCPRKCSYCAAVGVYYDKPNWRPRDVKSVIQEIKYLKNKYPEMDGIFFDEEVHNISKSFIKNLTDTIREEKLDTLHYNAMCEYASLDEEMLINMKKAGYYKIRIGIETASPVIAEKMDLNGKFRPDKLNEVLLIARNLGLKVYGTFLVGAIGSSNDEDKKTVDMIYDLTEKGLLNDLQISISTPQPGTAFYDIAEKKSFLLTKEWWKYDGANSPVIEYPDYSAGKIKSNCNEALSAYDKGREKFKKGLFKETIYKGLDGKGRFETILIIRSARLWQVNLAIDFLKDFYDVKIDALSQDNMIQELKAKKGVAAVYNYGEGFLSKEMLNNGLLEKLKENKYGLIVLPMNNRNKKSYQNVIEVAELIGPREIIGISGDGNVLSLSHKDTRTQKKT